VRPDRNLRNVELKSVLKKWKDKAFTAAIDRQENRHFIDELGVPFDEHVQRVLDAMKGVADGLGVAGTNG
jgi:predicted hydrolase (HD superfamily)